MVAGVTGAFATIMQLDAIGEIIRIAGIECAIAALKNVYIIASSSYNFLSHIKPIFLFTLVKSYKNSY